MKKLIKADLSKVLELTAAYQPINCDSLKAELEILAQNGYSDDLFLARKDRFRLMALSEVYTVGSDANRLLTMFEVQTCWPVLTKAGMTVFTLMGRFSWLMEHPFSVRWTPHTPKFILWALAAYGFAVALYLSTRENRRPGEEHGSAKWGSAKRLNAKDPCNNTILTQNVRMSLNGKMHRRNLLQIVIGGSGAGKTRFFVKPNLMEANCSFLVTDPKGETLRAVAPLLLQKGYVIKVFDLIDPSHSDSFNAFAYIKDDKDVMKLVNNFIKNTTPKGAQQNDPFWERSEIALDTALILYLIHEAPPEEQNFEMLIYMIENGGAKEDDDDYRSPLDLLFEALEEYPNHIAVREYKIYKQAAGDVCSK